MSSAASISAAKRRRGQQPTFTNEAKSSQQQSNRYSRELTRINPMVILENHELRLREIEKKSKDSATVQQDGHVESLLKENEELKKSIVALSAKISELLKVKDMVINMQSSMLSNTQKVETLKSEVKSLQSGTEVVSASVSQEIEDVTADMSQSSITFGDDKNQNVTFTVEESSTA
mgnify:CR=1 FL=1